MGASGDGDHRGVKLVAQREISSPGRVVAEKLAASFTGAPLALDRYVAPMEHEATSHLGVSAEARPCDETARDLEGHGLSGGRVVLGCLRHKAMLTLC